MINPSAGEGANLPLEALDAEARLLVERALAAKHPLAVTADGQIRAVLVDAEEFQLQRRKLALLERITRARDQIAAGQGHSQAEVEAMMDEWFEERE